MRSGILILINLMTLQIMKLQQFIMELLHLKLMQILYTAQDERDGKGTEEKLDTRGLKI